MNTSNPNTHSRRQFVQRLAVTVPSLAWIPTLSSGAAESAGTQTPAQAGEKVRDRFWAWAHDAHCYDNSYGLPRNGRITPVEGAHYLGVPNIILIRYNGKPAPPYEQYAVPFKSLKKIFWSITGAGGATSVEDRNYTLQLAASMPSITGVFMDDFFHIGGGEAKPNWLAQNNPTFPVALTVTLAGPARPTRLELEQSDWHSGDYRSKDFAVDLSADGDRWEETARGVLPNTAGAPKKVTLPGDQVRALRIRILSTYDTAGALSCGLRRVRLWAGEDGIPLNEAKATASSSYPDHEAESVLSEKKKPASEAAAALSVQQLREIREELNHVNGRRLDLGVTLYTNQLEPSILSHLEFCDVVSLWTWNFEDLKDLESNFEKLKEMVPNKRILLGCYMWGFGSGKPVPLDLMRKQCELGLKWLKEGRIWGMIFLATNICDLGLEAVEWSRQWIAQVGDHPL
ncbi:MAG: discoidin domain-containing protein [Candidatus Omnitrophica bacterium]|nr:discoidin domain-containing protein [Candidatus Omnitrophota bacterium]